MTELYTRLEDGTVWPALGSASADVQWQLRYLKPTKEDIAYAVSVMSAYRALINKPQRRRNQICSALKKAATYD